MKKLIYIVLAFLTVLITQSCKEELRLDHTDNSGTAPGPVSNIKVENTPGGAWLTYNLTADVNLSYVKAVYEIQPGVFKESKSSIYTDTLRLEGFGDTKEHEVKIYSVGKNEKVSEPVIVKINPLTPAVDISFNDLSIEPGFGGVKVRIKNELLANLAIVVEADTSDAGVFRPLKTFYTAAPSGAYSIRGLSAKPMKFSVYLRDRWGNKSQSFVKELTPLFEKIVPKPFGTYPLPTDQAPLSASYPLSNMWDGVASAAIYASANNTPMPQWFTVDLKMPVVLSRMKSHQRSQPFAWVGASVKVFELWGSNAPASDGSWGSWTLISKFESRKPSGSVGITAEDNVYAYTTGEDFEMLDTPPAFRYLRFKTLETWGGTGQVTIAEITFWGNF